MARTRQDRSKVAGKQKYEVDHIVDKYEKKGITKDDVEKAIAQVGHGRRKIYKYLNELVELRNQKPKDEPDNKANDFAIYPK